MESSILDKKKYKVKNRQILYTSEYDKSRQKSCCEMFIHAVVQAAVDFVESNSYVKVKEFEFLVSYTVCFKGKLPIYKTETAKLIIVFI